MSYQHINFQYNCSNSFGVSCLQGVIVLLLLFFFFFFFFLQMGITQERGITLRRKNTGNLFFMRTPYMKFQKPSMHGSKVMLCTNKRD